MPSIPQNLRERATGMLNDGHSEHLGQSFDRASKVCQRCNMLRKLTCIAGSRYSSGTLYDIIP